jgi:hypothetical protein
MIRDFDEPLEDEGDFGIEDCEMQEDYSDIPDWEGDEDEDEFGWDGEDEQE